MGVDGARREVHVQTETAVKLLKNRTKMTTKFSEDSEVNITFEDQQKINTFARHNARLQDLKEELQGKQKELQNLEDAADELLMAEDEEAPIPYMIGEVFVHCSQEDTTGMLEAAKVRLQGEITGLEDKCTKHKELLSQLKVQLYAKFEII